MSLIKIEKTVNRQLLVEELADAYGDNDAVFWLASDPTGFYIQVPSGMDDNIAISVLANHDPSNESDHSKLRNAIISRAQSSVGVTIDNLDNTQIKALLVILLARNGAIDPKTLAINPLSEWV